MLTQSKNFSFKKSLGQNFLIDNNIINNIVNSCSNLENTNIIEIGPGSGNLTKALLFRCKTLTAIEKDKSLISYLEEIKKNNPNKFNYLIEDATNSSIESLPSNSPKAIVANLPYNVGTFLFTKWLPIANTFSYFVLMFQKEVALRITARVNENHYGRLALFTKLYGNAELLFTVSKNCFKPKPLVDSAVIRFVPNTQALKLDYSIFTEIVKQAFLARRKTIKVGLKKYNFNFKELNIDPKARPENLSFEQFSTLSQNVTKLSNN